MKQKLSCLFLFFTACFFSGCITLPLSKKYVEPPARPAELEKYYGTEDSYSNVSKSDIIRKPEYSVEKIKLSSKFGDSEVHYYRRDKPSDEVVFIFPILGGKNIFEPYFAEYFVRRGIEAAIVQRNNDFKNPKFVDRLEEIFKNNLIRDRIVVDYFEREVGKKKFGSFGISRGGINVSMTAGVDPRLKYNVILMGATDIVNVFKTSSEKRIKKYVKFVSEEKEITKDQFYEFLRETIKTDPKNLAHYMNAKDTLLILSSFDSTVPFKYGMKLREQIGNPKTIVLAANHFTSILFTQFVPLLVPRRSLCLFPFPYVEDEALGFFEDKFRDDRTWWRNLPLKVLKAPVDLITSIFTE